MAADKESTSVAKKQDVLTLNTLTKDNVPELLEIVKEKIKNLQPSNIDRKPITVELEHFGKIQDINSVGTLIAAHSSIVNREKFYNESKKILFTDIYNHLKAPVFKINGHPASQWVEEIEARIKYLVNKKELDKLNQTKTTLESHLSEDLKLQQDLAKIQSDLTSNEIE